MSESERTFALDVEAAKSIRFSVPNVKRPHWLVPEPGQWGPTQRLLIALAVEIVIALWIRWTR